MSSVSDFQPGSVAWCADQAWEGFSWEDMDHEARRHWALVVRDERRCASCGISHGERWGGRWGDPVCVGVKFIAPEVGDGDAQNMISLCMRHWDQSVLCSVPDWDVLDPTSVDWFGLGREAQSYWVRYVRGQARCCRCGAVAEEKLPGGGRVRLVCRRLDEGGTWDPANLEAVCMACHQKLLFVSPPVVGRQTAAVEFGRGRKR